MTAYGVRMLSIVWVPQNIYVQKKAVSFRQCIMFLLLFLYCTFLCYVCDLFFLQIPRGGRASKSEENRLNTEISTDFPPVFHRFWRRPSLEMCGKLLKTLRPDLPD